MQTPTSVRVLFRNPCSRVAEEVAKVLIELANSIRERRRCSPDVLSDQLHDALKDLNRALKSQPRLFLGSYHARATNALAVAAAAAIAQKPERGSNVSLPSVKTDSSALAEWRVKKGGEANGVSDKKMLRPTLSKIAVTSLEFSEALPFAGFTSLLVETMARLDLVIEEVEELGRVAGFKEYQGKPQVEIQVSTPSVAHGNNHLVSHGVD